MLQSVLSNTATPVYYSHFRDKVLRGEIPVCKEIEAQMNRIDRRIADPRYYYDRDAVEGFIKFCESELTLTDGRKLNMLDSFKLWAEDLYGWYYFVERKVYVPATAFEQARWVLKTIKKRLCTTQYLIVARGAAKSMYAYCVQAYELVCNPDTTHQITIAPTMKQAEEIISPFRTALARCRGPLFKFLTAGSMQNTTGSRMNRPQLASTKKGIENFITNSLLEIRPMAIAKVQGLRPKVSSIDEWLSTDIREDVVGAIRQGAGKLPDYLIVAISSEGTVRNGPGDTIKMELQSILFGEEDWAPHVSIWHYKLDSIEEVEDPATWPKANPNIGITVQYEEYHQDVERAAKAPASQNDTLAKRFGIPAQGTSYFFAYEDTIPRNFVPHRFHDMACAMGVDLSQGDDFCSFTFLFPMRGGYFGVKTRSYISQLTLDKLPGSLRQKYGEFIDEGSLIVMDGNILDVSREVYDDLEAFLDRNSYDVRAVGYDTYNAKEFMTRWQSEHDPLGYAIEKVIQGRRTETVPLGELKKMAEEKLLIFDELIMQWTMSNATVLEDVNGQRMLIKQRQEEKVDNVSALMDAWVVYKLKKEDFE